MLLIFLLAAKKVATWWAVLIPAIIASATALITTAINVLYNKRRKSQEETELEKMFEEDRNRKEALPKYLQYYSQLHNLIQDSLAPMGAGRIVIFYTENGGGVPRAGSRIYSSVYMEAYDPPMESLANWLRYHVEGGYASLLTEVYQKGYIETQVQDILVRYKDRTLQSIYEASHVESTYIAYLLSNEKAAIFLSVHFSNHDDMVNAHTRAKLAILKLQVSYILGEMERLYHVLGPTKDTRRVL